MDTGILLLLWVLAISLRPVARAEWGMIARGLRAVAESAWGSALREKHFPSWARVA